MRVRWTNLLLIVILAGASWLGMMVTHECGHVLNARLSGGRVERVVLHPLAFSRTDVSPNPRPRLVAWGGVAWGSALPLVVWLASRRLRRPLTPLWRFFAGFCLIANGVYLVSAVAKPVGDADDLIWLGVPRAVLVIIGVSLAAAGLCLWHGLATHLGPRAEPNRPALAATLIALGLLIGGMLAWTAAMAPSIRP